MVASEKFARWNGYRIWFHDVMGARFMMQDGVWLQGFRLQDGMWLHNVIVARFQDARWKYVCMM